LTLTDDGENRYGVDPTRIVVVGPVVVHATARAVDCFGVAFGFVAVVVTVATVAGRDVAVAVGEAVFVALGDFFGFGAGAVGLADPVEVGVVVDVTGGDAVSCTSTFAGPLLHAVAASTIARAAATLPEVRMPA
jgi:hypothetical protein